MKRRSAKFLLLVLVFVMITALAAGCRRNDPDTIEIFGKAGVGEIGLLEGWFGKMIMDEFDMVINQISAPDGNNHLLWDTRSMAGHLGDLIIVDPEDFQELIDAGLILDLTDWVNSTYMPYYTSQFPQGVARARNIGNGRIWGIPTVQSSQAPGSPLLDGDRIQRAPYLRQDLYFAIGAPPINTLEDLPGVLAQMRDLQPTLPDGRPVYGFTLWGAWCNGQTALANVLWFDQMYGMRQWGQTGSIDPINQTFESLLDPNGYYRRVLKMYFEANQLGLIDPDSATQGDDLIWGKVADGQVLFSWYSWFGPGGFNNNERDAEGIGMTFTPIMDQTLLVPSIPVDGEGNSLLAIGSGTEDPERLIRFLDWLANPDTFQAIHAGPEGLTWEMVNGEPVITEFGIAAGMADQARVDDVPVPEEWGGGDFVLGSWGNPSLILRWRGLEINPNTGFTYDPRHWPSLAATGASRVQSEWSNHYGFATMPQFLEAHNMIATEPIVTASWDWPARPDHLDIVFGEVAGITWNNAWRMIFADSAADFDAIWDDTVATVMGLGWQELEDWERSIADQYFAHVNAYLGR